MINEDDTEQSNSEAQRSATNEKEEPIESPKNDNNNAVGQSNEVVTESANERKDKLKYNLRKRIQETRNRTFDKMNYEYKDEKKNTRKTKTQEEYLGAICHRPKTTRIMTKLVYIKML